MRHRRHVEQAGLWIDLMRCRERCGHAGFGAHREIRADGKDRTRPLPDLHEYLRRRLAIERELADVFNDTYNFPWRGVAADVDLDADRVLIWKFAARGGLVDEQHARPTRRIILGQSPALDDAGAHNGR